MIKLRLIALGGILLGLSSSMATAHVGLGDAHDAAHGFIHPLTGVDHILAMISVGLLAAHLGGRAIWAVPTGFLSMMFAGGLVGMSGFQLPYSEVEIGISVIALGFALALSLRIPVVLAITITSLFAIFHGFVHGAETPENFSFLTFAFGFMVATSLFHLLGIAIGMGLEKFWREKSVQALKVGGGFIALAGIGALIGLV